MAQMQGRKCQDLIHCMRGRKRNRHNGMETLIISNLSPVKARTCVEEELAEKLHMVNVDRRTQGATLR